MPPEPTFLCIDTTAAHCAAAIVSDGKVLTEVLEPMKKGQSERLFSIIGDLFGNAGMDRHSIDGICVATGPGNFTGVRIGVSAARGLGLALGRPVIGISVLEAMASSFDEITLVTADARADMVYWQIFDAGAAVTEPKLNRIVDIDASGFAVATCAGFDAETMAVRLGCRNAQMDRPKVALLATVARSRDWSGAPTAAPLYIKPADAALPSRPALRIVV